MTELEDDDCCCDEGLEFEYCINKKGGEAVLFNNHIYNYHSTNDDGSIYWRCANRPCSASVTTWNERASIDRLFELGFTAAPTKLTTDFELQQ
ncbi:unnamed protein product [Brachionus calyciflorus]|uniref:FLYWCH-type domain-containing protein n=1 Tax=Brachionus calyciflorus TaxID=104777 RepID=A0A814JZA3_9BILA|nr:unnamed protein product [Brachionus calyciflorus]